MRTLESYTYKHQMMLRLIRITHSQPIVDLFMKWYGPTTRYIFMIVELARARFLTILLCL